MYKNSGYIEQLNEDYAIGNLKNEEKVYFTLKAG